MGKIIGPSILAAALNKDEANSLWAESQKHRTHEGLLNLHEIGFLKQALKYAEPQELAFSWVKNGKQEEIQLEKGQSYSTLLFPTDELTLKKVEGKLGAIIHFSEKINPAELTNSDTLSLERFYVTKGQRTETLHEGDLVEVHLIVKAPREKMKFAPASEDLALKITDILPSGLTPVSSVASYDSMNYSS